MTDNLDDFDQPEHEHENGNGNGLPPPSGVRGNLAQAWRTRPLFKLLVLMTVVGALIAVSINLFSSGPPSEIARLAPPPSGMHEPPGGPASPYFNQQTMKATQNREQAALSSGGSALPTPIGQTTNLGEDSLDKQKKDPLVELRNEVDRQKQQIVQMQQQPPPQKPPEQFDDSLAQAMQAQMRQLMESWVPHGIRQVDVAHAEDMPANMKATNAVAGTAGANPLQVAASTVAQPKTLVPAGTVSYAQLLTEANSDVPGPILAQIVSGPLSGARAIGKFKVTNELLILQFSLANSKGKDYAINAIALDPDTTLGAMATDVDERYFTRVILPAAAGFMQGFGTALGSGSTGSSVVTNGTTTIVQQSSQGVRQGLFQGIGQAAQTAGQFFQNRANQTQPLVRVAAGTPMGLFFVSSVTDQSPTQSSPYPYSMWQPGMTGLPGYGYPGAQGVGVNDQLSGGYSPGYNAYNTSMADQSSMMTSNAGTPYPNATSPYNTANSPAARLQNPLNTLQYPSTIGTPYVTH